jgi:hypothetical protein
MLMVDALMLVGVPMLAICSLHPQVMYGYLQSMTNVFSSPPNDSLARIGLNPLLRKFGCQENPEKERK